MPDQKGTKRRGPYPAELRERAIRLVRETAEREGSDYGVVVRIAGQLGVDTGTLRSWIKRDALKNGPPELASAERRRLAELERENRELRRAYEILKAASAFFAAELDRHEPK